MINARAWLIVASCGAITASSLSGQKVVVDSVVAVRPFEHALRYSWPVIRMPGNYTIARRINQDLFMWSECSLDADTGGVRSGLGRSHWSDDPDVATRMALDASRASLCVMEVTPNGTAVDAPLVRSVLRRRARMAALLCRMDTRCRPYSAHPATSHP